MRQVTLVSQKGYRVYVKILTEGEGKKRGLSGDIVAICEGWTVEYFDKGEDGSTRHYSEISILASHLRHITHELVHAAVHMARTEKVKLFNPWFFDTGMFDRERALMDDDYSPEENGEELLAYAVSNWQAEFWDKLKRRGIVDNVADHLL